MIKNVFQSNSVVNTSTALILYDPTLPHISTKTHLEKRTDEAFRRSFEAEKTETRCLSPLGQRWKEKIVTGVACGMRASLH